MARKSDFLAFAYRVDKTGGLTGPEVLQAMYDSARLGTALPPGLEVTWQWQNAPEQDWREEDFETVVTESGQQRRSGFVGLMLRRIQRDAGRHGVTLRDTELREATEAEIEAEEERLEEAAEAPRRVGQGTRKKAAREEEQFQAEKKKRSAAGKKAAETRKRNAEHRKRSAAAKKGWLTRRRNERARAKSKGKKRR